MTTIIFVMVVVAGVFLSWVSVMLLAICEAFCYFNLWQETLKSKKQNTTINAV